jgi:hypothetical protein
MAAIAQPRRMTDTQADLALGVLITLGFFAFYPATQGHGWGYRYAYQVLGNLCLLAAAGVPLIVDLLGVRMTKWWLVAGLAVALVIQIPLRMRDTERFVRPFAAGNDFVHSRDATVVLLWANPIWYGRDLVRNDPFLRQPVVVQAERLAPSLIADLKRLYPGRVVDVTERDLLRLGMTASLRQQPYGEPERPPLVAP